MHGKEIYQSNVEHHKKYLDDLLFQKCDLKWAVGLLTWNTGGVLGEINNSNGNTGGVEVTFDVTE